MRLLIALLLVAGLAGCTGAPRPDLALDVADPAPQAPLQGTHNKWTAKGPYPDSFSPFTHSAGISYEGPSGTRTVQGDLAILVGTEGWRMLHLYHLFTDANLGFDPNMKAVLDDASTRTPKVEILLGTLNSFVTDLFQTRAGADRYVAALSPYLTNGVVKAVSLGNELNDRQGANVQASVFKTAAANLRASLDAAGFTAVPVTTTLMYGGITSYPPASARFQDDGRSWSMEGYLQALEDVSSKPFLFVNPYPSFTVTDVVNSQPALASWYPDFGLFKSQQDPATHDGNLAPYWALFDLQYNTVLTAADAAHLDHVQIYVGETGWPDAGGGTYTTPANEAAFVNNLLNLWVAPQRSSDGKAVPTFLFRSFDDPSLGPAEGHWGIHDETGTLKPGIALPDWLSH